LEKSKKFIFLLNDIFIDLVLTVKAKDFILHLKNIKKSFKDYISILPNF